MGNAVFNWNWTIWQLNPGNQTAADLLFHFREPPIHYSAHDPVNSRGGSHSKFHKLLISLPVLLLILPGDTERGWHNNDGMTSTHQPGTNHIQQLPSPKRTELSLDSNQGISVGQRAKPPSVCIWAEIYGTEHNVMRVPFLPYQLIKYTKVVGIIY